MNEGITIKFIALKHLLITRHENKSGYGKFRIYQKKIHSLFDRKNQIMIFIIDIKII